MSESFSERKQKDDQVRETINNKLIQTGERERLKELLNSKLIECGWRDQMKVHCKEIIKNKGIDQITIDDLVEELTPTGRGTVPDAVKAEILQRIRTFIQNSSE